MSGIVVIRSGPEGPPGPTGPTGPTGPQGPTGSGSNIHAEDEGTPLGTFATVNFTGPGVTATDAGGGVLRVDVEASPPTGTGFVHVTSGVQDGAAVAVNLATADVTGITPIVHGGTGLSAAGADGQVLKSIAGAAQWADLTEQAPVDPLTQAYFEAWVSDTVTLAGSVVTNWQAKTGTSARDFATMGADPTVVTDGAFGNRQYVHFNGGAALRQATASAWNWLHDGTTDWTMWCVCRPGSNTDNTLLISDSGTSSAPGIDFFINGTNGDVFQIFSRSLLDQPLFMAQRTRRGLVDQSAPFVLTIRHKVGEGLRLRVNGLEYLADAAIGSYSTADASQQLTIGFPGHIDVAELGFFKTATDLTLLEAYENWLGEKYGIGIVRYSHIALTWSGNSLLSAIFTPKMPDNVRDLLEVDLPVIERMNGISGQTTPEMITRDPGRVDAFKDPRAAVNIVVGQEMINDMSSGSTVNQALDHIIQWAADRKAAGFLVVLGGITPTSEISNGDRATVNAALEAGEGVWFDALARVESDPDIGQNGQNVAGVFYSDTTHFTATGDEIRAPYFAQAIRKALAKHISQDTTPEASTAVDNATLYMTSADSGKKSWVFSTGAVAANQTVRVPRVVFDDDAYPRPVFNGTAFDLTFSAGDGTQVVVHAGDRAVLLVDSTGVRELTHAVYGGISIDINGANHTITPAEQAYSEVTFTNGGTFGNYIITFADPGSSAKGYWKLIHNSTECEQTLTIGTGTDEILEASESATFRFDATGVHKVGAPTGGFAISVPNTSDYEMGDVASHSLVIEVETDTNGVEGQNILFNGPNALTTANGRVPRDMRLFKNTNATFSINVANSSLGTGAGVVNIPAGHSKMLVFGVDVAVYALG